MKKFFAMLLVMLLVLSFGTTALAASITIDPNVPAGGDSTGETYTAYKVFDATISADGTAYAYTIDSGNKFFNAVQSMSTLFNLTPINSGTVYNVTFTGENTEAVGAQIAAALNAVLDKGTPVGTTVGTDYEIKNLDEGYYLVTSSLGTAIMVDTTNGDITVMVEEKNAYPTITKVADKETADYGEPVNFTITVNIPETASGTITVHDKMDNLSYVGLAAGAPTTVADNTGTSCSTCTQEFVITGYTAGDSVVFTYTATVNAKDGTGDVISATNEAWLTYSEFTSVHTPPNVVDTYIIDVYKYFMDGATETALEGAGFVLKNAEDKYYKLTNGDVTWVDTIGEATELTTGADGKISNTFAGIAAGTYTLIENTVPAGYNKADDVTVTTPDDANPTTHIVSVAVENKTGAELPSTGGVGTTIFYVVGGLLMVGALVLIMAKRRASAQTED